MQSWMGKPYYSLDAFLHEQFQEKVYKAALDAGFTCPNRDGTAGERGCIFCSAGGSGDFAGDRRLPVSLQLEQQIRRIRSRRPVKKFIAYFQAFTNTYGPAEKLEALYREALSCPEVAALSIATRPDCLPPPVVGLLARLNREKPIWVELGLQTIHEKTAAYIRRGYPLSCFEEAVKSLRAAGLDIIVHVILGLPGETGEQMLDTIRFLNRLPIRGIKLQLLHVLAGTDLAEDYEKGYFRVLAREEYIELLIHCLEELRPDIVIHRLTGDGPKKLLIAPQWSSAKRSVLNTLHHEMALRRTWQGRLYQTN